MSYNNPPNPFGPYTSEVNALQRAVNYLQEHKSKTQSNQSAENVTAITPPVTPLDQVQRDSIAWAVHDAVVKLEDSIGRRAPGLLVPILDRNLRHWSGLGASAASAF